jgi:hypothetical protein
MATLNGSSPEAQPALHTRICASCALLRTICGITSWPRYAQASASRKKDVTLMKMLSNRSGISSGCSFRYSR